MIHELADELLITVAVVVTTTVGLLLWTICGRRQQNRAWLRLDHFLPYLRKTKKSQPAWIRSRAVPFAHRVLPASCFSDRVTGQPGSIRRLLKFLGPSVVSSPLRRILQAVCLGGFAWLFFYVCWPYDAQPSGTGPVSRGWRIDQLVGDRGDLQMTREAGAPPVLTIGQDVHLVDDRAPDAIRGRMGVFQVVECQDQRVVVSPRGPLTGEQIDSLLTSTGTWSLHEQSPWPAHYAEGLAAKELVPAELFLVIDPLVSLSTAVASRNWVWSLAAAAMILIACVVIPRGFCGYVCPLGTLIDVFDWLISGRIVRFRVADDGWWVHLKYYLLLGTLVCSLMGVLVSGYVAAIPVVTRGLLFIGEPLQVGVTRGWNQLPPPTAGHVMSVLLFVAVFALGFLRPRFWCKYVCPSGAVFSLGNLLRITERKVEHSCIHCNKCVEICPFDAIKPDFTTRVTDCTLCQTCAGVCPTHAIKFVERWNLVELKIGNDPPTRETALGRRGFLSVAAGSSAAILGAFALTGATKASHGRAIGSGRWLPVRPPGSVPETAFLEMCIRCGECFKACPFHVLQPLGFQQGLAGLWTPQVVADHSGCAPSCNTCGEVCPTGAIRALTLDEKQVARIGLAVVNAHTCLPIAGREACQLCVDECNAAGYYAIEFTRMHTQADSLGNPIEGTGLLAPVVLADRCVGCGLCQMSCYRVNVRQRQLLDAAAIVVECGPGKEDRLIAGSYRALRQQEAQGGRQQEAHGGQLPRSPDLPAADYFAPTTSGHDRPPGTPPKSDSPF